MSVRGKFQVTKISQFHYNTTAREITLSAVCDTSIPEDAKYAKYTPSGTITMVVDNPPASDQLGLGKFFYVDFTEVQPATPTT